MNCICFVVIFRLLWINVYYSNCIVVYIDMKFEKFLLFSEICFYELNIFR